MPDTIKSIVKNNFINQEEVNHLWGIFQKNNEIDVLNVNPEQFHRYRVTRDDNKIKDIFEFFTKKIQQVPDCENQYIDVISYVTHVESYELLHTDTYYPNDYGKTIIIPIQIDGDSETGKIYKCKTITFNQYFYQSGRPAFTKGTQQGKLHYHNIRSENDYSKINYLTDRSFDKDFYFTHLQHIPYKYLDGMNVERVLSWIIGGAIIFDRARLHTANDWRKYYKYKTFIHLILNKG